MSDRRVVDLKAFGIHIRRQVIERKLKFERRSIQKFRMIFIENAGGFRYRAEFSIPPQSSRTGLT